MRRSIALVATLLATLLVCCRSVLAAPLDAALRPPSPRKVRAVLHAAVGAADLTARQGRLSSMARRARWAALLPEIRARASQTIGEYASATPDRPPAESYRTGLYFELRATWSLDRLVFSREEIQIERLKDDYGDLRRRRLHEAAAAVGEWVRARSELALVEEGSPEWIEASSRRSTSEALLEELTGGQFSEIIADPAF